MCYATVQSYVLREHVFYCPDCPVTQEKQKVTFCQLIVLCKFGNQYEFLRQIKFFPNFSNPRKLIINVPIVPSFSDLEKPLTSCSRRYYCNNFSIPKPSNNTAEKKNGKKIWELMIRSLFVMMFCQKA